MTPIERLSDDLRPRDDGTIELVRDLTGEIDYLFPITQLGEDFKPIKINGVIIHPGTFASIIFLLKRAEHAVRSLTQEGYSPASEWPPEWM